MIAAWSVGWRDRGPGEGDRRSWGVCSSPDGVPSRAPGRCEGRAGAAVRTRAWLLSALDAGLLQCAAADGPVAPLRRCAVAGSRRPVDLALVEVVGVARVVATCDTFDHEAHVVVAGRRKPPKHRQSVGVRAVRDSVRREVPCDTAAVGGRSEARLRDLGVSIRAAVAPRSTVGRSSPRFGLPGHRARHQAVGQDLSIRRTASSSAVRIEPSSCSVRCGGC